MIPESVSQERFIRGAMQPPITRLRSGAHRVAALPTLRPRLITGQHAAQGMQLALVSAQPEFQPSVALGERFISRSKPHPNAGL